MNFKLMQLDTIDIEILDLLQHNANFPIRKIAENVGLSYTPTYNRVNALRAGNYIERYAAILNRKKIGLNIVAFVHVRLKDKTAMSRASFERALQSKDEVQTLLTMSGKYDYLLKVTVEDIKKLHGFLSLNLGNLNVVAHFESNIVLSETKTGNRLPLSQTLL